MARSGGTPRRPEGASDKLAVSKPTRSRRKETQWSKRDSKSESTCTGAEQ